MEISKPILYTFFRSSCAWRVRIALAYKGIDCELRPVNLFELKQEEEEFKRLNPMGQVPVLVVDGKPISQSMSILEYIEEMYPEKPLLPKDSIGKAKVREMCEILISGIQPYQSLGLVRFMDQEKLQELACHSILKGFTALETLIEEYGGDYCFGNQVTLADCCLVPQVFNLAWYGISSDQFNKIVDITERLSKLESFKIAHLDAQPDCPPGGFDMESMKKQLTELRLANIQKS